MGYLRFQIGSVFAEYDLFKPTISIYIWIFVSISRDLGTSDITFMGRDQELK